MKKILGLLTLLAVVLVFVFTGSGKGADLLILNWGDYMSTEVIHDFEKTYGVTVKEVTVDSNELMYQNIINQNAEYDLVLPSDYMIDQMMQDGLLLELDFSKLENYQEDIFVPELNQLMNSLDCKAYKNYYIPYFWGSLSIMYSKRISGVEEAVLENGFKVLFERNLLPDGTKCGMYNVSRDALAAAELYLGYSLNTTDKNEIDTCMSLLKNTNFDHWGTDELKREVSQGNLDVALVYSGDFFDAYYTDVEGEKYDNLETYGIYAPKDHNNVFFDGMAIPVTSSNPDLAYKMIDFLLEHENSYTNTGFVGYCPTLNSVFEAIMEEEDWEDVCAIDAYNPTLIVNHPNSLAEVYR
ncbi:extracellular solute-binding protein, partial [bacterium]|nr:extracellular solute-binding protein [bacterium]